MEITLTDDYIAELIACPKVVIERPKREFIREKNRRQNFTVVWEQTGIQFRVFTRQLLEVEEFYSVGLVMHDAPGLNLLRYNGIHAPHTNPDGTAIPRAPHIHRLDNATLKSGVSTPDVAFQTDKYFTFKEAKLAFVQDTNIQGWQSFWPELLRASPTELQPGLFDNSLESNNET